MVKCGWAAICDALADGSLDAAALRRLFAQSTPGPFLGQRELWVVDGTIWPRPAAKTSPERTWGRLVTAGTPESGIIGAWEYPCPITDQAEVEPGFQMPIEVALRNEILQQDGDGLVNWVGRAWPTLAWGNSGTAGSLPLALS